MARFDVHEVDNGTLVVVCQSELLDHLEVRFVAPLVPIESAPAAAGRLNPTIDVQGRQFLLFPQWSSGMASKHLGQKQANIEAQGLTIINAFDMLISGI